MTRLLPSEMVSKSLSKVFGGGGTELGGTTSFCFSDITASIPNMDNTEEIDKKSILTDAP